MHYSHRSICNPTLTIKGVHMTSPGTQFPHIPAYFCTCTALLKANECMVRPVRFEVRSMHLASFIVCRELVMTVNILVHERNATCRIIASVGSLTCWYLVIKSRQYCLSRWQCSNACYDVMTSMHALYYKVSILCKPKDLDL